MKLRHHVALSALLSGLLWLGFRSLAMALAAMAAGVLLDVDHWFDYWREHPRKANLSCFFAAVYGRQFERGVFVFHAWEWTLLGLLVIWALHGPLWLVGVVAGQGTHLLADQWYNRPSRWGYSLVYRWRKGFRFRAMFPDDAGA